MTRKARSSTLCEWAVGVSVEDYCDSLQRRRSRRSSSKQRITVEISTDDESEEDTVRITYPRATRGKDAHGHSSNVKKVRFDKVAHKSALKTLDSAAKNSDKDSDAESSGNGSKEEPVQMEDVFNSGEETKPKKSGKKKKKAEKGSKKQKVTRHSLDGEDSGTEATETESESEEESPSPPQKKKQENKKESKKGVKKSKQKFASTDGEPNNVGPTSNARSEKDGTSKKEKAKKSWGPEQLRPEANLSPHLRRPNLIMPVRAEVLQVEHTIEGVEDPRPNAFIDPQHGVVRVYHGPAYGNPYGLLYPARDPSKATLPIGLPHPLQNPYFTGFANPTNPGDNHFKGQSPWNNVPITCFPGGPPLMAPVDPMQMPPGNTASPGKSPKAVMSRANQGGNTSPMGKNKEQGWDTNVGPESSKVPSPVATGTEIKPANQNMAPTSPININLTVNPNTPWAQFANNSSKKSSPNKDGSQAGSKTNDRGSNNGSKKSWGSKKISDWQPLPSGQHPDLQWDSPAKSQASNSGWAQIGDTNNDTWGAIGGNGSNSGWFTSGNGASGNSQRNYVQGASNNDNTWGDVGYNHQATKPNDTWGLCETQTGDTYNRATTSKHADSNNSNESNKNQNVGGSNPSANGQAKPDANWDGQGNNVGFSGRPASHGSNGHHQSWNSHAPASNGDWNNNAGPAPYSPVGNGSNKSGGSKSGSKKGSNNGDPWKATGDSAWIPENNAGPTTNSPNASQTLRKSDKHDGAWLAGNGAGWGPGTTSGEINFNPTSTEMSKNSNSNRSMPGAWEPENFPPWGDATLAQSTNGAADLW